MANFRTHAVCGGLWGTAAGMAAFLTGWCSPVQSATLGVLGVIGAALPDIDSRNARPRQILLGVLGVGIPVLLAGNVLPRDFTNEALFCWMIAADAVIRYGADFILSRCSRHRGAFHSIPAALMAGEATFLAFPDSLLQVRFAFALAVTGGYLSHLLLDELCSWNYIGASEKKSAGSAFTWKTESAGGTLALYLAAAILGGLCFRFS